MNEHGHAYNHIDREHALILEKYIDAIAELSGEKGIASLDALISTDSGRTVK